MSLARAEADLVSARNEVRRYEGLLEAAQSRVTKLEHYIEVARRYAESSCDEVDVVGYSPRRPRGGKSGEAIETAIAILREERKAIRTRELVERLRDRGISVSDVPERETANLSAYLSRAAELVGDRTLGWRLKEWEKENPDNPWEAGPLRPSVSTHHAAPASQQGNVSLQIGATLPSWRPRSSVGELQSGVVQVDPNDDIPF